MTDYKKNEGKKSGSAIIRLLSRFAAALRRMATGGLMSRVFGCYTREDEAMKNSFASSLIRPSSKFGGLLKKLRFIVAEQFEESRILLLWRKLANFLVGCKLRLYGAFTATFAIYVGLVYFFKRFILVAAVEPSYLIWAVVLLMISIPLVLTRKTLAGALVESRVGNFIVSGLLGIPDEKLSVPEIKHGDSYNIAILAGIVAGLLTYFVSPSVFVLIFAALAVSALILTYPEIGVVLLLLFMPLLSFGSGSGILIAVTDLISIAYLLKLIRGKRTINFEFTDLLVLFFVIMLIAGGFATAGGEIGSGETTAMVSLLLGCFVAGNLMKTAIWQKRCVLATVFSGFAVSLVIIWELINGIVGGAFSATVFVFGTSSVPFFGGTKIIPAYLIVSLALLIGYTRGAKGIKNRLSATLVAFAEISALIITGFIPGWLGAAVAILAFFLIMSEKTVITVIFAAIAIPSACITFGGFVSDKLSSISGLASETAYPIIRTWQGTVKLILASSLCGIGAGGFERLYPLFAEAGFEGSPDASSLGLRILCETGIVGLIIFAAILFVYFQNCFEYLRSPYNKPSRSMTAAGIASVAGVAVLSCFCDIWSNNAMFFVFWAVIYIITAAIRSGRREIVKREDNTVNDEMFSSIEL